MKDIDNIASWSFEDSGKTDDSIFISVRSAFFGETECIQKGVFVKATRWEKNNNNDCIKHIFFIGENSETIYLINKLNQILVDFNSADVLRMAMIKINVDQEFAHRQPSIGDLLIPLDLNH